MIRFDISYVFQGITDLRFALGYDLCDLFRKFVTDFTDMKFKNGIYQKTNYKDCRHDPVYCQQINENKRAGEQFNDCIGNKRNR